MNKNIAPVDDLDYNLIIAEFINIKIKEIVKFATDSISGVKKEIQLKLKSGYSKYLTNLLDRYGKSRSVFIRDEPKNLYSFYVPIGLQKEEVIINSANLRAVQSVNQNAIISGFAGSGKSILLKHLLINSLKDQKQIPIYIELRDLNKSELSLFDFIMQTLNEFNLELEESYIHKAFSHGHFIVFLDGLDEVINARRINLIKEIDTLQKKYPKGSIIISSRPDHNVAGLQAFTVMHMLPLTLEQSIELINKLPAEEEIKEKFISDLKLTLFEKHKSFLSNPLLLTIMLLTYGYSADIPSKLSIFYNQAYEALFERHDALKGSYKRTRNTTLDIKEFAETFSAFCIQTYDERKFHFSRKEAIVYIEKTKGITNLTFNTDDYLTDLLQSVCLLVEDGLFISFTHRSFQEYFAALFIVESREDRKARLLNKYQSYIGEDNIYKLVFELDRDFIECEIVLPFIEDLLEKLGIQDKVNLSSFLRFSNMMWDSFNFREGRISATVNQRHNLNNMVWFCVFVISNEEYIKKLDKQKKSAWIESTTNTSLIEKKVIRFPLSKMKVRDQVLKEMYNSGRYFSKALLEILIDTRKLLRERKILKEENLENILFRD